MNESPPNITNGDAQESTNRHQTDSPTPTTSNPTHYPIRHTVTTKHSSLDLIYATASGFLIGFCVAAGIGIILAFAIKAMEGIDGE